MGWKHGVYKGKINWSFREWYAPCNIKNRKRKIIHANLLYKLKKTGIKYKSQNIEGLKYIICSKNPYANFISYRKYFCRKKVTPLIFAKQFNKLYGSWLKIPNKLIIRYEDLLNTFDETFDKIITYFGTHCEKINIFNIVFSTGHLGSSKINSDYYIKKFFMNDILDEEKEKLRKYLNNKILSELGYFI